MHYFFESCYIYIQQLLHTYKLDTLMHSQHFAHSKATTIYYMFVYLYVLLSTSTQEYTYSPTAYFWMIKHKFVCTRIYMCASFQENSAIKLYCLTTKVHYTWYSSIYRYIHTYVYYVPNLVTESVTNIIIHKYVIVMHKYLITNTTIHVYTYTSSM